MSKLAENLGNPVFLRKVNGWLTIFWLANFPPILALYVILKDSAFQAVCLLYLALVSIWANVAGHASGWQSARVEVHQDQDANVEQVLEVVEEIKHGMP